MAGRVSSPELVGRGAEVESIVAALDRAAAGEPERLLIAGEAGVGKTRLTNEVIRLAHERGFRVMRGECVSVGGSSLPFGPLVEALRGLLAELDPAAARALAGTAGPDLARLVPGFGPVGLADPGESPFVQSRLFEAILGLLGRLAERSPVLLVIEDLHWADAATREAFTFLVRALRGSPVMLIGTYRSDELHRRHPLLPWLAELERGGRVDRLELGRLDREQVAALLSAILETPARSDLVEQVFERSDGNPFFAEELLAAGGGAGSDRPRLRETLREILQARIARVDETASPVLRVAAVAGRRVEHDLLATVAGLPEADLLAGLRAAVGGHLLVVEARAGEDRYVFRHALVQEAVYDDLLPGERRSLHRRFAEALDARVPGSGATAAGHWAELAHHWAEAHEDRRAFEASIRAGAAAIGAYAFGAAQVADERALDLWDGVEDAASVAGVDRVDLLRRAGQAAYLAADFRRSVQLRREAIGMVDAEADPIRAGILHEELGRALYVFGEPAAALEAYGRAVSIIPPEPATAERARAVSGFGQILMLQGRYEEAAATCEEAIAIARSVGATAQEGHALNSLGFARAGQGQCAVGIPYLEEALRIAREIGNADDIGRAYVNLGEALDECGRTAEAVDVSEQGLQVAEEIGVDHSYGHYIRLNSVSFLYMLGRWTEATRLLDVSNALAPPGTGPEVYRLSNSLRLLVGRGAFGDVDPELPRVEDVLEGHLDAQYIGPLLAAAAERELWRRAPTQAVDLIRRGLERVDPTEDRASILMLCRTGAWAAGDLADEGRATRETSVIDAAREQLAGYRARVERLHATSEGGASAILADADRKLLDAEALRVDGEPDPVAWRAAGDAWAAAERPYVVAYCRWREGETAVVGRDRAAAADALRTAREIADRLGAAPLRGAIDGLARRARIDIAIVESDASSPTAADVPASEIDRFGLTARETEVLALVADGRTNRQIGELLFISESTAGVHVSNILGKLGVASRGEAAAVAFRLGVVPATAEASAGGSVPG